MSQILTIRVETESGSIYQLENQVEQGVTHVQRLAGAGAFRFWVERAKVIRYSPIVVGKPFVVTAEDDWDGESRTTFSTPVIKVNVTLA